MYKTAGSEQERHVKIGLRYFGNISSNGKGSTEGVATIGLTDYIARSGSVKSHSSRSRGHRIIVVLVITKKKASQKFELGVKVIRTYANLTDIVVVVTTWPARVV